MFLAVLRDARILAEQIARNVVRCAIENLLAIVAGKQPVLMVDRLTCVVGGPDQWLLEVHRIRHDHCVRQMIATPDKELLERRLVAFGNSVPREPALLQVRGAYRQRGADESAGRESHPGMRSVRGRMWPTVHPDGSFPFERLAEPMNRDQLVRVRVTLLPRPRVAKRAH